MRLASAAPVSIGKVAGAIGVGAYGLNDVDVVGEQGDRRREPLQADRHRAVVVHAVTSPVRWTLSPRLMLLMAGIVERCEEVSERSPASAELPYAGGHSRLRAAGMSPCAPGWQRARQAHAGLIWLTDRLPLVFRFWAKKSARG